MTEPHAPPYRNDEEPNGSRRQPTYFISHGGGPWPWMTGPFRDAQDQLEESLQRLPGELPEAPKAILMVSGHWEAPGFAVQTHPNPPMCYDYGGFPEEMYQIQYPTPGSPELAGRVVELLTAAGIAVREDAERGYDHGMYAVLFPAWPDADVPVVQLAVDQRFDPAEHLPSAARWRPCATKASSSSAADSATTTCASWARAPRSPRPASTSGSATR